MFTNSLLTFVISTNKIKTLLFVIIMLMKFVINKTHVPIISYIQKRNHHKYH